MSSRDRSLLAVIVLIIVAVGGYFLVVEPAHSRANKVQAQIESANSQLTSLEQTVQQGEAAEAQYKTYAQQFTSISAAVPSDEQIPELINELQSASNRTKVSFQAVTAAGASTAPTTTASGATAITFPSQSYSLSFTGSYFAVANLLGQLSSFVHADDQHFHASGRLISISTVGESSGGGGTAGTSTSGTTGAAVNAPGKVTALVTAVDYDVPSSAASSTSASPIP